MNRRAGLRTFILCPEEDTPMENAQKLVDISEEKQQEKQKEKKPKVPFVDRVKAKMEEPISVGGALKTTAVVVAAVAVNEAVGYGLRNRVPSWPKFRSYPSVVPGTEGKVIAGNFKK